MGVTIHHKAVFNSKASLAQMIEEVKDIADTNGWPYHIWETKFPKKPIAKNNHKRYGIFVSPPRCESVDFSFSADGTMPDWQYTKTQFAGSAMHIVVVNLLRYISKKYYSHIEVDDEGDYWQTNDEALLQKQIDTVGQMIKLMHHALEETPKQKGEKIVDYITRVAKTAKRNL
jgi:hypothetical protein